MECVSYGDLCSPVPNGSGRQICLAHRPVKLNSDLLPITDIYVYEGKHFKWNENCFGSGKQPG